MGLLAPLFLLGLAAVAVPVLIHLRLRHRSRVVRFPSLMFISQAPYRSMRRRRLRDVLLLLMRCLAVALLALAFARPLWQGDAAAGATSSSRLVVVLLDNSFSMGFGDRWQRAAAAAESAFADLEAADRGALVVYSDEAELQSAPTTDAALLAAMVQDVEIAPRSTSLLPAIQMARGVLAEAGGARPARTPHRERLSTLVLDAGERRGAACRRGTAARRRGWGRRRGEQRRRYRRRLRPLSQR